MNPRCPIKDCSQQSQAWCPICNRPVCEKHMLAADKWIPLPVTWSKHVRQTFNAAARAVGEQACFDCRASAGHQAVAALPPRLELPTTVGGILAVWSEQRDQYTDHEIVFGCQNAGGVQLLVAALYPHMKRRFVEARFRGLKGLRLTGLRVAYEAGKASGITPDGMVYSATKADQTGRLHLRPAWSWTLFVPTAAYVLEVLSPPLDLLRAL